MKTLILTLILSALISPETVSALDFDAEIAKQELTLKIRLSSDAESDKSEDQAADELQSQNQELKVKLVKVPRRRG